MGARGLQDLVTDDDLGQTGCVAKIDEGNAAMVASVPNPSGESHLLADVAGSQASGVMGSQHVSSFRCRRPRIDGTGREPAYRRPPQPSSGTHCPWGMPHVET